MSAIADRLYTPSEAAAVSGVGVKAVNNAIDKRIVKTAPGFASGDPCGP